MCNPIVQKLYAESGGDAAGEEDDFDGEDDLEDHDKLFFNWICLSLYLVTHKARNNIRHNAGDKNMTRQNKGQRLTNRGSGTSQNFKASIIH